MDIKQRLAFAAKETHGRPLNVSEPGPLTINAELARDALAELERMETRKIERLWSGADGVSFKVSVRIDIDAVAVYMARRTRRNSAKSAQMLGGAIKSSLAVISDREAHDLANELTVEMLNKTYQGK